MMFSKTLIFYALASITLLGACGPEPKPLPYISQQALEALPPKTNLYHVIRREDGCYFIQTPGGLSGNLAQVRDRNGQLVCDEV